MTFLTLKDFEHLHNEPMIKFKEETVGGKTLVIISYMISFPELWKIPLGIECRGITFDPITGNCVCRPFEKFFNVGENEHSMSYNLPWDKLTTVMEKRDGSMLTPVHVNGKLYWKTKKSFYSDVAVEAAANVPDNVVRFSEVALSHGFTPIFEYTSPTCEIVLGYGRYPQFVLLAMRNHTTGNYMDYADLVREASYDDVKVIKQYDFTFAEITEQMKTVEDFEGYVLRFDDGDETKLLKIKCEWYMRMHRVKTDLRVRDVADMLIDEKLDDVKSAITAAGLSLEPVEAIEKQVAADMSGVVDQVNELLVGATKLENRKAVAIAFKDHHLFSLLMKAYSGQEPDYKGHWVKYFRTEYSLKTIYSNYNADDA